MQHDLFANPNRRARAAYPLLVILEANFAEGDTRIVAPLTPAALVPFPPARVRPVVSHDGHDYSVMMRLMTTAPLRLLRHPVGSIAQYREDLSRALDWLFFGI